MAFSPGDFSDWSKLGEGGEAEVFRARQISLDRLVAIKRLKLSVIGGEADVRRFEGEARLCASLNHPSLVQVYDYGRDARFYYLVMEYLSGADLARLEVSAGESLQRSLKLHLARQMAEAMEFIHAKGILHRDLKPENFMVDASAHVKLLDLGLALERGHTGARKRATGMLTGTLAYLPPERLQGGNFSAASDLYALAVVLLEFFGGRRLHEGRSADELLALIQTGIRPEEIPGVTPELRSLLAPYLHADPSRRPGLGPLIAGLKSLQTGTVGSGSDRETLHRALLREKKTWLTALIDAADEGGRLEEAFARLKELLEADPEDAEAHARLTELTMRLNSAPAEAERGKGKRKLPRGLVFTLAGLAPIMAAALAWFFYIEGRSSDDMGRDLMEREMNLLSKENEDGSPAKGAAKAGVRVPARPYGVLIVKDLPKQYRVEVNRARYQGEGEIHLPASRYMIEIRDGADSAVFRDSVTVGAGEPTVYRYAGRTAGR